MVVHRGPGSLRPGHKAGWRQRCRDSVRTALPQAGSVLTDARWLPVVLAPGSHCLCHPDSRRLQKWFSPSASLGWPPPVTAWRARPPCFPGEGRWQVRAEGRPPGETQLNSADESQGQLAFLGWEQKNPCLANLSRKGICRQLFRNSQGVCKEETALGAMWKGTWAHRVPQLLVPWRLAEVAVPAPG